MEEIGPYGTKGSGIVRFVWSINDGSTAEIIFDSYGRIISIYITGDGENEIVYDRY